MVVSEDTKNKLKELSKLTREIYGIREKEKISYKNHPLFVKDVIKDFTNISYNLAIADHISSEAEKDLLLLALEKIFYADGNVNPNFMAAITTQFEEFMTESPSIESPIHILEKAKQYDTQHNKKVANRLRDLIVAYAEALVLCDGFESIKEFDVVETFKTWVYE